MKVAELHNIVREVISEVKKDIKKQPVKKEKEEKLPKSSGKLMDLKKEYKALTAMKEQLQSYTLNEETQNSIEPQFSHMQKFVNELTRIRENTSALASNIDAKLAEIKNKIMSEKEKIKEMIGLSSEKPVVSEEEKLAEVKNKKRSNLVPKKKAIKK